MFPLLSPRQPANPAIKIPTKIYGHLEIPKSWCVQLQPWSTELSLNNLAQQAAQVGKFFYEKLFCQRCRKSALKCLQKFLVFQNNSAFIMVLSSLFLWGPLQCSQITSCRNTTQYCACALLLQRRRGLWALPRLHGWRIVSLLPAGRVCLGTSQFYSTSNFSFLLVSTFMVGFQMLPPALSLATLIWRTPVLVRSVWEMNQVFLNFLGMFIRWHHVARLQQS